MTNQLLLLLLCARSALSMGIENVFHIFENSSSPSYSENLDDLFPYFQEAQCEKADNEIYLKFSDVGFQKIGQHFIDSFVVTCLSLDDNEISEISMKAFERLPNLHFLDLSGNKISANRLLALRDLNNLKTLVLDNVFSTSNDRSFQPPPTTSDPFYRRYDIYDDPIPQPYDEYYSSDEKQYQLLETISLPNLKALYLRKNNLKSFTLSLHKFSPNLTNLHLSQNNIGEISSLFVMFDMFPPHLTHLSLDDNSIRELSGQKLQNFIYVNLNRNNIRYLYNNYFKHSGLSLQKASNLQYLSLSGNEITNVDEDAFSDTLRLYYLDLSHNQIKSFEDNTFERLTDLREFIANNNLLQSVPNFSMALNLRNITLSDNQIKIIPKDVFGNLLLLKSLSLDGNWINSIEENAFFNLSSLEYLDLSRNQLTYLPQDCILTLTSLRVLLLNENLFADFNDLGLKNAISLSDLHIEDNSIHRLNTKVFAELPTNLTVHFHNSKCQERETRH